MTTFYIKDLYLFLLLYFIIFVLVLTNKNDKNTTKIK